MLQRQVGAQYGKYSSASTISASLYDLSPKDGFDIRTVQELLGREDLSTAMIYAHALTRHIGIIPVSVRPLDGDQKPVDKSLAGKENPGKNRN